MLSKHVECVFLLCKIGPLLRDLFCLLYTLTQVCGVSLTLRITCSPPKSEFEFTFPSSPAHKAGLVYSYRGGKHEHLENIHESFILDPDSS